MKAKRVCSVPNCPTLTDGGRCPTHRRIAEQQRGSPSQRGYGTAHRLRFRAAVLTRYPACVICHTAPSTVADHYPLSRRELVAANLDPDNPEHGRGLCRHCDARQTARRQPGGWNDAA